MQINTAAVRKLRDKSNWTQQHLADACGLSLRTVQRMEKTGSVSHETAAAVAAVFEVSIDAIKHIPEPLEEAIAPRTKQPIGLLAVFAVTNFLLGAAASYWLFN